LAQKLDGQTKVDAKNERSKKNWHKSWKAKQRLKKKLSWTTQKFKGQKKVDTKVEG
jgi:hypothetical protein